MVDRIQDLGEWKRRQKQSGGGSSSRGDIFPTLTLGDCVDRQRVPVRWLIDGILPETGLACLFGLSNSFKSFTAIDMSCRIAHGLDYHGRSVTSAPVLYLALEGSSGIVRQRIPGWHHFHDLLHVDPPLRVIETTLLLSDRSHAQKLKNTAIAHWDRLPGLVVVDVLKRAMDGSDADDKDVAKLIHTIHEVFFTAEWPCLVLAITHAGFSHESRARGHSDLWGSYDTRLRCEGDKSSLTARLIVDRHKDAESGGTMSFRLEQAETGMVREDLSPITTLVPCEVDHFAENGGRQNLTELQRWALRELANTISECGEPPSQQLMRQITTLDAVTTLDKWREKLRSVAFFEGVKNDRSRWDQIIKALKMRGKIGINAPYVWLAS